MQESSESKPDFRIGQRVHSSGDPRRIGTVRYVGPVQGYSGTWVGVDWDNGEGKHDGTINGVQYFQARSEQSGSFVRSQNLSSGISLFQALQLRYRGDTTKEEEGMSLFYQFHFCSFSCSENSGKFQTEKRQKKRKNENSGKCYKLLEMKCVFL